MKLVHQNPDIVEYFSVTQGVVSSPRPDAQSEGQEPAKGGMRAPRYRVVLSRRNLVGPRQTSFYTHVMPIKDAQNRGTGRPWCPVSPAGAVTSGAEAPTTGLEVDSGMGLSGGCPPLCVRHPCCPHTQSEKGQETDG